MPTRPAIDPLFLEAAYCQGVFPMGDPETGDLLWYRPDPRTLIDLEDFHVPRRLAKTMRGGKFRFTIDQAFDRVIRACARTRQPDEMWITPEIVDLYCQMHALGKAHSVEAWVSGADEKGEAGGELAGGLYGVALGGAFMGESMFHEVRDASKAALVFLVRHLRERGYILLDTQFPTPHLSQFGLILLPHSEYMKRLRAALQLDCRFDEENS